jgi:membrane protease YdiL (CAAX protease family)
MMEALQKFLFSSPKTTFLGRAKNILAAYAFCFFWVFVISAVWFALLTKGPDYPFGQLFLDDKPKLFFELVSGCVIAPLWEELAYRFGPIQLGKALGQNAIIPIVAMASMAFGWGHGYGQYGILVQGVMGILFSIVYIKNGFHYLSSVILHALWNFSVMFFIPYFFQSH